jgi:hypothetical protein
MPFQVGFSKLLLEYFGEVASETLNIGGDPSETRTSPCFFQKHWAFNYKVRIF